VSLDFPLFLITHTPTTEIYTLSLHDALPISWDYLFPNAPKPKELETYQTLTGPKYKMPAAKGDIFLHIRANDEAAVYEFMAQVRSEEHTSELQSRFDLVCRLLLEKKKKEQTI